MVDEMQIAPMTLAAAIDRPWAGADSEQTSAAIGEVNGAYRKSGPLGAAVPADISRLFEDFSRATSELVAAHEALQAQVDGLKDELAQKNKRLERKKRLEALGRVAAGVAHEFRNPLGGVRLTVDALLRDQPTDRSRARLEHVQRAVTHLDRIVENLLSFARNRPLEKSLVAPAVLLDRALEIAFPPDGPSPAPRIHREGPPGQQLLVDPHAFTQVLVNLLVNSAQALRLPTDSVAVFWGEAPGFRPWLEVADEGCGITPGEEESIFLPFHTSRPGGTGLGLAIVHDRVEAHEGEIALVRDAWGGCRHWSGARFRILLPAQCIEREV